MWKQYTTLCEDIDFVTACNVADGTIANSFSTTTDFGAMVNRIGKGEQITKKSNSGPLCSKYDEFMRSIRVLPEAYHGVSLTGIRAGYFVKANHGPFWQDNFYNNK